MNIHLKKFLLGNLFVWGIAAWTYGLARHTQQTAQWTLVILFMGIGYWIGSILLGD